MRTVYVTRRGAVLRRHGGILRVVGEGKPTEVTLHDVGQIVLMGNVTLTPAALDLLLERAVDTVFLTHHGRYRGRIVHAASTNVSLRLRQYAALTKEPIVLELARAIVQGKIANQRRLLQRYAHKDPESERLPAAVAALGAARLRARDVEALDGLRGCEGSAAAAFFRVFGELLRADGFCFAGRNRRPPLDPVNAMLSLGYTLLHNAVEAAVNVVGLDPHLGALHAPLAGRPSLVCDLTEEFRTPVVDALVVAAVNRRLMKPDDFVDEGPGLPVTIERAGMAAFVRLFEQRLRTKLHYRPVGARLSYRDVIEQQTRHFARVVLGEEERYQPFEVK